MNRRTVLKALGLGGMGLAGYGLFRDLSRKAMAADLSAVYGPLPAHPKNPKFADAGRPLTSEDYVLKFNNFYEFGFQKHEPAYYAKDFKLDPYTLTVDGLVENPKTLDLDDIEKLGLEERVYRFRCVERWSMAVPWIGVPLHKLIEQVKPKSSAKFVAFQTFLDPEAAPGQKTEFYPWPYQEGLRLDEAMNELTLMATGLFGKRLAPQSGTPLRIITPWKYGYKGAKSIVKMTFTDRQPKTFWNEAQPAEYKFYSNVDPQVSHPRWSQAEEWRLGESQTEKYPTKFYNGYEEEVGELYAGIPRTLY
jgi:sulfoxide reductase catalytic subunit YedY